MKLAASYLELIDDDEWTALLKGIGLLTVSWNDVNAQLSRSYALLTGNSIEDLLSKKRDDHGWEMVRGAAAATEFASALNEQIIKLEAIRPVRNDATHMIWSYDENAYVAKPFEPALQFRHVKDSHVKTFRDAAVALWDVFEALKGINNAIEAQRG
jgi:hypothetical protein